MRDGGLEVCFFFFFFFFFFGVCVCVCVCVSLLKPAWYQERGLCVV